MARRIGIAAVVLFLASAVIAGLVSVRYGEVEEQLDYHVVFTVPGAGPERTRIAVDGVPVQPEKDGWSLIFNGERVPGPVVELNFGDLLDAGTLDQRSPPPGDEFLSGILEHHLGFEGRLVSDDDQTWGAFLNHEPCMWFHLVQWLHPGDLLDPFLLCLARHPETGAIRVGTIRLQHDGPVVITGWGGRGGYGITPWKEALRTKVRTHQADWRFALKASDMLLEQAGLKQRDRALTEAGAKGWYVLPGD